jgi:hypothetical protein
LIVVQEIDTERYRFESGEVQENRTYPAKGAASLRAKIVCGECNEGWMSDLETDASRLLSPLIAGKESSLDQPQQLLAAFWATKTAMVGEQIMYQPVSFSQEDRELLREGLRPTRPQSTRSGGHLEGDVFSPPTPSHGGDASDVGFAAGEPSSELNP